MVTEKNNETDISLDRLLREDLTQYDVPSEVLTNLKSKILALLQRPERKPFGASVLVLDMPPGYANERPT